MITNALPLLLRLLSDREVDVPLSVNPFVTDLLRIVSYIPQSCDVPTHAKYKKWHVPKMLPPVKGGMRPPPSPSLPVSPERRKFLAALLDVCVRQLAWPDDADWEAPGGEEPDPDDDLDKFWTLRMVSHNTQDELTRSTAAVTSRSLLRLTKPFIPRSSPIS